MGLLLVAIVPSSAQANKDAPGVDAGMGCPQGYVAFDAQRGQGGPPSYLPGETVTASGYLTDAKANAAPSVKVRWGSPEGAVLGEVALDSEGNYKGLTFAIPEETPRRIHTLYLEARDPEGNLLPGLPIPARLRVGPPPAPPTAAPKRPAAVPVKVEKRSQRPSASPSPQSPQPQALPLPQPRAGATTEPVSGRRSVGVVAPRSDRAATPSSQRGERPPDSRLAQPGESTDTVVVPRTLDAAGSTDVEPADGRAIKASHWKAGLAGLLGLFLIVAIFLRRRAVRVVARRPLDPPPAAVSAPEPEPSPTDDSIEAELQEMISEERAREALEPARETVEAGH